MAVDALEEGAQAEAVTSILIEGDVAPCQSCLTEVIDEELTLQRQRLEAWDRVAQDLYIGEACDARPMCWMMHCLC